MSDGHLFGADFAFDPRVEDRFRDVANAADPYTPGHRNRAELAEILAGTVSVAAIRAAVNAGWALVTGLPVDTDLPLTPTDGKRSPVKASKVSEALLNGFSHLLDMHPVAYDNEKDGDLIHQVHPVAGWESSNSNRGADTFAMHIEAPHHPFPPDVIALTAVRNFEYGATNFSPMADVLETAPEGLIDQLHMPEYTIRIGESFGHQTEHVWPIAETLHGVTTYRVDLAEMRPMNARSGAALDWLRRRVAECERRVVLQPGDLLIVNNRQTLHGRVGFRPDYARGLQRWLQRQYMTVDPFRGEKADARWPHVWSGAG